MTPHMQALGLFTLLPAATSYADRRDDFSACKRWVAELYEAMELPAGGPERAAAIARVWDEFFDLQERRETQRPG